MTAKEKAEELVHKYNLLQTYIEDFSLEDAKHCALIAVDELLEMAKLYTDGYYEWPEYYEQVKQEIEKL